MDWRRQAVVLNGAESHNDFWRVGHGNAEWMFGTRNVPCFWLDKGVAHGCPFTQPSRLLGRMVQLVALRAESESERALQLESARLATAGEPRLRSLESTKWRHSALLTVKWEF